MSAQATLRPVVTGDEEEARLWVSAGHRVVLVVAPDGAVVQPIPARMAVMVGDLSDPVVRAAAEEMAAELYAHTIRP
ncbi:MAG TPA: hypothetical protein VFH70_09675 [Acidimicrobiales bacterium]|nr:hypothetical protein [Acidimicrobiales bacterium]